LIANLRH